MNKIAIIVLAAGKGSRMDSNLPKVMHQVGTKPLIVRTLDTVVKTKPTQIITVVLEKQLSEISKVSGTITTFVTQKESKGTADATKVALSKLKRDIKDVCIMYGDDSIFYKPETIKEVLKKHLAEKNVITFVSLLVENPKGLGRVARSGGKLEAIIEEKDATKSQKQIKEVNDGLYFIKRDWLEQNLKNILPSKVTGEYYITDLITLALNQGKAVNTYLLKDVEEWHGINTPEDLESANKKLRVHIMGIAGAGAAAVAGIAKAYGFEVTGCDTSPASPYVSNLDVNIKKGHSSTHIKNIDLVVISPAVYKLNPKNPEVMEAKRKNIPTLTWQEFQGEYLQKGKFVITVAGAYGKSTTTSMIAKILTDQKVDPTVEIGARVKEWSSNFRVGKSNYYVCESDEYNDNFLFYEPDIAVVLNVGWDHPDYFKTKDSVVDSYKRFIKNIKPGGILIVPDDPDLQELVKSARNDIKIIKIGDFGPYSLSIIGDFRKENANAALTVASVLKLNMTAAKKSVESFSGIGRRLEYKGDIKNTKFFDDYAVQPYTVKTTASALVEKFPGRKIALVFEPHTFSRIETFFVQFSDSLRRIAVENIFITDVFAAREKGNAQTVARKLTEAIGNKAQHTGSIAQTAKYLAKRLDDFDIVLTMGAGDVYKIMSLVAQYAKS